MSHPDQSTKAGTFLAATPRVSVPHPVTLTSSMKMLLSHEVVCEATCLHRRLWSTDQNSFRLPHPLFLGIYTLQKPINSPALLLILKKLHKYIALLSPFCVDPSSPEVAFPQFPPVYLLQSNNHQRRQKTKQKTKSPHPSQWLATSDPIFRKIFKSF